MSGEWEAGKGDKPRAGVNLRAYWEADYWKILEEKKKLTTETAQISSECSSPDTSSKHS